MNKFSKLAIVFFASFLFILALFQILKKPLKEKSKSFLQPTITTSSKNANQSFLEEKIILKVGQEFLYQKDFELEWSYYPFHDEKAKKLLLEKMIQDSKILQIAQKEGILTLDESIYNSPSKDYLKRVKKIQEIKKWLAKNTQSIRGTIVSIWFLNDRVGPLGYKKAREIAWEKINKLHQEVTEKKITIDEAAKRIREDKELALLDPNYQTNASFDFDTAKNPKITWEENFNETIKKLKPGETTAVFTGKSFDFENNGEKVEAYFLFGQVKEKEENTPIANLEEWLAEKSKEYETIYY